MRSNASVIYGGIEPKAWRRLAAPLVRQKVTVGIVAVFDKVKGHHLLLQSLKIVLERGFSEFTCLVAGDGREKEEIFACVQTLGLENHVEFLGYREDVAELMEQIDVLVVPSTQEAFGMVAVEAMAKEIPVVATEVGGLSEVIEDGKTGVLVPPGDSQRLADGIVSLIQNPMLRHEMGRRGRERVLEYFDFNKNLKSYENEIRKVLDA